MSFAALTLDAQLEHLGTRLDEGGSTTELLELCATLRDHAPLAWLATALLQRDWFDHADHREQFAVFLQARSETAVHRILRGLTHDLHLRSDAQRLALSNTLLRALDDMPLRALSSMCLVDRALKHNFEPLRTAHVQAVVDHTLAALERGDLDAISDGQLAQVPASANARMRELADAHGPELAARFEARRRDMARAAIEILGSAPKAVSQANAEELLARRVYTDPGHFLIELLQNAEDAGARTWRVVFDADRIVVWHDGAAFDARDLVGVTSIGQTTKRKQQIGFFGVGFKSVFEVTDRPRVYSDVFNFEIADVSIPRWLAARPDDVPPTGTVLVLPLRDPDDPVRSPAALYEKARAIDPCVLFTLPEIDIIDLELTDRVPGGPRRHTLREHHDSWSSIRQTPDGWTRKYVLHDSPFEFAGGHREAGRATATRVMVGVLLDEANTPGRLEPDAATIYSYLPTAEPSGLGFWIQAHFDVPVDRERITVDSDWNRWVLAQVPHQLAHIAARITAADGERNLSPAARHRMAAGLLGVLPLPGELNNPVYRPITDGLAGALGDVAIVPGEGHALHRPADAVIAAPEMHRLFGLAPLDARLLDPGAAAGRQLHFAAASLPARTLQVLRLLGCRELDASGLIDMLERLLAPVPDGQRPDDELAPAFLHSPDIRSLRRLFELLLTELERLERNEEQDAANALVERLRGLPLVPGTDLGLHRASAATPLVRARQALRDIYGTHRDFLHPELDIAIQGVLRVTARQAVALLERLGIEAIEIDTLIDELEAEHGARDVPLDDLASTRLPGDEARLARILDELATGPGMHRDTRRRAARLPLWRATDGRHHRAATARTDHGGVLHLLDSPGTRKLLAFYGTTRPILAPELTDTAAARVLEQLECPTLDIECLVEDLRDRRDALVPDLGRLRALHALLEDLRDELPTRLRRTLAELPIWPDRQGRPGPLKGRDTTAATRVLVPVDETIVELLPEARFLDAEICARSHLTDMAVDRIGVDAVVGALLPDAQPPLRLTPSPGTAADVLRFLLERTGDIGPRVRERLMHCPVFLDDHGQVATLADLTMADDTLRELYGDPSPRRFIDTQGLSMQLVAALELEAHLHRADATTLVDDLTTLADELLGQPLAGAPLLRSPGHLAHLLDWLAGHAATLPHTVVQRVVALPIFADTHGRLARLAPLDPDALFATPAAPGTAMLARPDLVPTLVAAGRHAVDITLVDAATPLARAAGLEPLDLVTLLEAIAALPSPPPGDTVPGVLATDALEPLHALLVARRDELADLVVELDQLPIWPTRAGSVRPAATLLDADALRTHDLVPDLPDDAWHLHGPPQPAERTTAYALAWHLAHHTPTPAADAVLDALSGCLARPTLAAQVGHLGAAIARAGHALDDQPPPFDALERIERMLSVWCQATDDTPTEPVLVDATGTLRTDPLARASRDTVELLAGLELASSLLHPALAADPARLERLGLATLDEADVLAALGAPADDDDVRQPVASHPVLGDPTRRARLYAWIEGHARALFTDPTCIEILSHRRLFASHNGSLLSARELVIDPDLPDLGIDWRPASEVPATTLDLLQRHLDAGRPDPDALLERHLLPALHAATRDGNGERAGELVRYLARALGDRPAAELRQLLRQPDGAPLLLEDEHGQFRPADALLLPADTLAPHITAVWGADYPRPSAARYPAALDGFLVALGVATEPALDRVREAMNRVGLEGRAALGLATIVGQLWRTHGRELEAALPLRRATWLVDGTGCAHRPGDLFAWSPEIESLVGVFDELYPDPAAGRLLGDDLLGKLGLRGLEHVELEHVVRHIDTSVATRAALPFRVYQWMEQGLTAGWLDARALERELATRAWVYTEGQHHPPERVIGSWALHLFGERRGYWERGHSECPRLCRLFKIPGEPTPDAVADFLTEIGTEVVARGDQALLDEEPALRRMLLASYALLGRAGRAIDRSLPVLLCHRVGPASEGPGTCLRPAASPGTLRSDTPTLEALFEAVGTFFLVARGSAEQRADVDAFYDAADVPRLREAYTVTVDESSGRDVSDARGPQIQQLRATLRSLGDVLPRVRLARGHLAPNGWVFERRLEPLTTTRPVRAIEQLRVCYALDGVGTVRTPMSAAYDPERRELLVDTAVLDAPKRHTTGLAVALMSCIYDGPGEDQLVDIIEILLPQATAAAMHAYLDQRHFPAADSTATPTDQLAERVGAILDYGLGQRLAARFPDELGGADLERWRDADLLAGLALDDTADRARQAARAAHTLLDAVDVAEPSDALRQAITTLLAADALDDIPATLLARDGDEADDTTPLVQIDRRARHPSGTPGTAGPIEDPIAHARQRMQELMAGRRVAPSSTQARPPGTPAPPGSAPAPRRSTRAGQFDEAQALEALIASLAEIEPPTGRGATAAAVPGTTERPTRATPGTTEALENIELPQTPGTYTLPDATPPPPRAGFWRRVAGLFGGGHDAGPDPALFQPPDWTRGNSMAPSDGIPPQLWATPEAFETLERHPPSAALRFEPARLPAPWVYAPLSIGARFDAHTQAWAPQPGLSLHTWTSACRPTGQTVRFAGRIVPGQSCLPVPLFARLTGAIHAQTPQGRHVDLRRLAPDDPTDARVELRADAPAIVRYEVELLEPSPLTPHAPSLVAPAPDGPTVALDSLPDDARALVAALRDTAHPPAAVAMQVQHFVRTRYRYDGEFTRDPRVEAARARLRPGRGNHHLELLHAAPDGQVLGRGICYELNLMVVELLRHLDIAAYTVSGWILDQGAVSRPTHLFALALVPGARHLVPLPLDAAVDERGPRHALPEPVARPTVDHAPPPPPGLWRVDVDAAPSRQDPASLLDRIARVEQAHLATEITLVVSALTHVARVTGRPVPPDALGRMSPGTVSTHDDLHALYDAAAALLDGDASLVATLMAVLRGDLARLDRVPGNVQSLAARGLVDVQTVPAFEVTLTG